MTDKKRVLIPIPVNAPAEEYLTAHGYEVVSGTPTDAAWLKEHIGEYDAAVIRGTHITADILEAGLPRLKLIARHGIGCDNVDVAAATRLGIQVTFTPAASTNAVAEHTMALILALAKEVIPGDRMTKAGQWASFRRDHEGVELMSSTLGLIGVGRIGTNVAKAAAYGFGMKVIAYDPYADPRKTDPCIELLDSREAVLEQADFVSVHMPLTEETRGSIGRSFLSRMKKGAFLINTSRGEIVNEPELAAALRRHEIRGAALDVYCTEPLPADNLFRELDNVICSAHFATITGATLDRLALHSAVSVDEVLSGMEISWPVNHLS